MRYRRLLLDPFVCYSDISFIFFYKMAAAQAASLGQGRFL